MAMYAKQKDNESKIVKGVFCILPGIVCLSYIPPSLCWLSTMIFGAPSSDHWAIPLQTDVLYVARLWSYFFHLSCFLYWCLLVNSYLFWCIHFWKKLFLVWKTPHSLFLFNSMQHIYNTRSAIGFAVNLITEFIFLELFIMDSLSFLAFYVTVCSYFRSCADDLKSIVQDSSNDITQRISMKWKLVQFIELHIHLYE